MNVFSEAIQISVVSVGIVFLTLLLFNYVIRLIGFCFNIKIKNLTTKETSINTKADIDSKKVAAIMTAFQEEFGDRLAEIKITRVNGKESLR